MIYCLLLGFCSISFGHEATPDCWDLENHKKVDGLHIVVVDLKKIEKNQLTVLLREANKKYLESTFPQFVGRRNEPPHTLWLEIQGKGRPHMTREQMIQRVNGQLQKFIHMPGVKVNCRPIIDCDHGPTCR